MASSATSSAFFPLRASHELEADADAAQVNIRTMLIYALPRGFLSVLLYTVALVGLGKEKKSQAD